MRDYEDKLNKAIKELETFKIMAKSESGEMAITMAIEALKREPVNKLTQQAYEDEKKDGYLQAKIDQILNTGWIPVSERLPEKEGLYLVSVKNDHERRYSKTCWFHGKDNWFARQDVIAWMSLPEPYTAGGSEECNW